VSLQESKHSSLVSEQEPNSQHSPKPSCTGMVAEIEQQLCLDYTSVNPSYWHS